MRTVLLCIALVLIAGESDALEIVTALDDGFTVPSEGRMAESSLNFPGTESFTRGWFATLAWSAPFGVEDIAVTTLHAGMRMGKVGVSCSFNSSGFELYGDEQEKIGVSFSPVPFFSAGFRVTRTAMHIKRFGRADAVSGDAGIVIHPVQPLWCAVSCEDIAGAEIGESREPLDGHSRLGVSWNASERITLLFSGMKVRRFDPSFSGGFTAEIANALTVGIIGGTEPDRFEFLGMVTVAGMHVAYRGSYHPELGMSHGFSMSWGE